MTAPDQKEKTAAAGFAVFMGLALGWAGVVVAAFAVATERAWSGGAGERERSAQRRAGWLDRQRSWLDADHRARLDHHARIKSWLDAGADEQTRPPVKPRRSRAADGLRRLVGQVAVAAADFAGGARDGWNSARKVRAAGGGFREVAAARPGPGEPLPEAEEQAGKPQLYRWDCDPCDIHQYGLASLAEAEAAAAHHRRQVHGDRNVSVLPDTVGEIPDRADDNLPQRDLTPRAGSGPEARRGLSYYWTCSQCERSSPPVFASATAANDAMYRNHRCPRLGGALLPREQGEKFGFTCTSCGHRSEQIYPSPDEAEAAHLTHRCPLPDAPANTGWKGVCPHCGDVSVGAGNHADLWDDFYRSHVQRCPKKPTEGDQMNDTTTTTPAAPAAESNATVLRGKLAATQQSLHRIAELTDVLSQARTTLAGQVRDAEEFATVTGQSSQARQALDEANALSAAMGERLGAFSEGAVSAEEQMAQASAGLRVAENAEDELRSAGADGRAVAPAGAAA